MFTLVIYDKDNCKYVISKVAKIKVKKNKLFVYFNFNNYRKIFCYNLSYYTNFQLIDYIDF